MTPVAALRAAAPLPLSSALLAAAARAVPPSGDPETPATVVASPTAVLSVSISGAGDPPSRAASPPPPVAMPSPPVPAITIPRADPKTRPPPPQPGDDGPEAVYVVTAAPQPAGGGDGGRYLSDSDSDGGGMEIGNFLSARSPAPSRRAFPLGAGHIGAGGGGGGGTGRSSGGGGAGGAGQGVSSARGVPTLGDVSARSTARSRSTPGRGGGGTAWWTQASAPLGAPSGEPAAAAAAAAVTYVALVLRRDAALAARVVAYVLEAALDRGGGDGCALRAAFACVRAGGAQEAAGDGAGGEEAAGGGDPDSSVSVHGGDNPVYWAARLFQVAGAHGGAFGDALRAAAAVALRGRGRCLARLLRLVDPSLFSAARFTRGEFIAAGAYGRVTAYILAEPLGDRPGGARVAVKTSRAAVAAPTSRCRVSRVLTDVALMEAAAAARDAGVVSLLDYGLVGEEYWLVMEAAECNLRAWRGRGLAGRRPSARDGAAGLAAAVAALRIIARLHARGAACFDIKADNFLLRRALPADCADAGAWERELCITDLGDAVCGCAGGGDADCVRGTGAPRTECTAAPEMLLFSIGAGSSGRGGASRASDVWAAGCLVFEVLTGSYLFEDNVGVLCVRFADPGAWLLLARRAAFS